MPIWYYCGMKLRTYLDETGLTEAQFADQVGLSQAAINRYCAGLRTPDKDAMPAIIKGTEGKVQPNDFFDIAEHSPKQRVQ